MKKANLYICIAFIFLISIGKSYSQSDTVNTYYFNNLQRALELDSGIIETKLVKKKISKGILQTMYVKYSNDPGSRYWQVGKEFIYNAENNTIIFSDKVDIKKRVLTDTSYSYNDQGKIVSMEIYTLPYDSVIPVKKAYNILSAIFEKYYQNMPNVYKTIEYNSTRDTIVERIFKYSEENGFLLNGDVIYFNANKEEIQRQHFEMGNEVYTVEAEKDEP